MYAHMINLSKISLSHLAQDLLLDDWVTHVKVSIDPHDRYLLKV